MVTRDELREALSTTLDETTHASLGLASSWTRYEGKVRDNYSSRDGRRLIVVTDRISAFDRVLGTLPFKGQLLNRLSNWWFEKTREQAPNHVLRAIDPQALIARECTPLPVEFVVRAYLTGVTSTSIWTAYARGERSFCGHALPDGLRKHDKLPAPIVTPSTKAAKGGHDVSVSRDDILAQGSISAEHFDRASELAMRLFQAGRIVCEQRGLMLVDTKYEFGIDSEGEVIVIDEIHTPDSSRYWFAGTYEARMSEGQDPESFDKEYVRRWLASEGFVGDGPIPSIPDEVRIEAASRYIAAFEAITGESFVPDFEPPLERLRRALSTIGD